MSRQNLAWLLGIVSVSVLGFVVSLGATARDQDQDYEHVRLFVDVLHEVRGRYVYKLTPEQERKLVEDMLNGGLERLNAHNAFINKREYKQFTQRSKGKFGGIGIHIGYDAYGRGLLTVVTPMVGTPAHEAGVLAGDVIRKIDGKSTEHMRLSEAIDLIKGDPGEKITLTVQHEDGEMEDIPMLRAEIKVPSVLGDQRKVDKEGKVLKDPDFLYDKEHKIGYIRLNEFSETSTDEMRAAVTELKALSVKGLVLDLRGNPGGLLRSAADISNIFLSEGKIVSTRGRDGEDDVFTVDPRKTLLGPESEVPLAVLVNRYSASASEIVSACLQDHKRAVIVGERSYGKGSVQNIIEMEKKQSALKLTTATYWRPSGRNIDRAPDAKDTDEWGVKPDKGFEVELTLDQRAEWARWRSDRDIVRDKKRPAPKKEPAKEAKKPAEKEKKPFVDEVLKKAVDHLLEKIKKAELAAPQEQGRA
jgi:carboxyl-terminal processing protease